jgi:hypothetical protein
VSASEEGGDSDKVDIVALTTRRCKDQGRGTMEMPFIFPKPNKEFVTYIYECLLLHVIKILIRRIKGRVYMGTEASSWQNPEVWSP